MRAQAELAIQQLAQTAHNGETEAQASGPVAFRIMQLHIFLKDPLLVFGRNTCSGIPDFKPNRLAALPASDDNASLVGMPDRIGDQITQDAFHEMRIGKNNRTGGLLVKDDGLVGSLFCEVLANAVEERLKCKSLSSHVNDAGIESGNVEDCAKQITHCRGR